MPRVDVLHTLTYEEAALEYLSDRQIDKLEEVEKRIAMFPDIGSPMVRTYLSSRFGKNLRKLVMDGYVIVYRHDDDAVRMLAIVPGRSIA